VEEVEYVGRAKDRHIGIDVFNLLLT
jgi:hypothetical protein